MVICQLSHQSYMYTNQHINTVILQEQLKMKETSTCSNVM